MPPRGWPIGSRADRRVPVVSCPLLSLPGGNREARNLHADRAQVIAAGEVECPPVVAPEREVGGGRGSVNDAPEFLAPGVHDPDAPGTAAIDVALDVYLHAVGDAGLGAAQVGEDAVRVPGQGAVGQEIEG